MKKVWGLLLAICFAAWQTACYADAPGVRFIPPGPGINAPLDTDGEGVDYGWKSLVQGNWNYDGDAANIDNNNGVLRYRTSNQGNTAAGPVAAMSESQDWVFELYYKHSGNYGGEWPWYLKAEENAADARIVRIGHIGANNTDDTWSLYAGTVGGGWTAIGSPFALGSDFNKFTVHYEAASSTLDVYRNDVPVASDLTLAHGNYAADFVQLEWMRQGTDSYQSLKLGQLIPEPTSVVLLAFGAIGIASSLRRRK